MDIPQIDASGDVLDDIVESVQNETTLYQILTGVFAGLSLILIIVTVWVMLARSTGRQSPIQSIQGGFSLGSLGSMMSTS